jgi:hypothetical protein
MEDFKYFKVNKSKERILKSLEELTLENKFVQAIENNCPSLVKYCIKQGIDLSQFGDWAIEYSYNFKQKEIVKILKKEKVKLYKLELLNALVLRPVFLGTFNENGDFKQLAVLGSQ